MPRKKSSARKEYDAKYQREYRRKNPEKVRVAARKRYAQNRVGMGEYHKNWRKKNKSIYLETARRARLKKMYDISPVEYDTLLASQNNLCALCDRPFSERKPTKRVTRYSPVLDHCHIDKTNRGFVHSTCNLGLGYFEDDPKILWQAIKYLERFGKK